MGLTVKQEKFCLNILQGMTQAKAYGEAGYSCKSIAVANVNACRLLKTANICSRIKELQDKIASEKIMSATERKERLSEIARANLTQFMELGKDGSWVNLGPETPHSVAIQEIHSRTEYDKDGESPTVYTSVKLHDPIRAIDLLNKMDKIYEEKAGNTININVDKVLIDARGKLEGAISRLALRSGEESLPQQTE